MENETDEQFEERVLNKRAAQMFVSVRARLQKQDSIQLSDMTYRNNRKQVSFEFDKQRCERQRLAMVYKLLAKYILIFVLFFTGGAKILLVVGTKEIPGARNKARHGIW